MTVTLPWTILGDLVNRLKKAFKTEQVIQQWELNSLEVLGLAGARSSSYSIGPGFAVSG